ncbi:MAG: hypothetical protein HYY04_15990 [Chloroflexi bacterium]|nr:hypothetical protein [Chloroflexota bacterium]
MSERKNVAAQADESGCATIPGTRMAVDWPNLVSGQDIILTTPPKDPLSGLLLGNGDLGVSFFGPAECLALQVGKNDIWDYRDPMDERRPITHREFLDRYADPAKPPLAKYWGSAGGDPWNDEIRETHRAPMPTSKPAGQIRFRNRSLTGAAYAARAHLWDAEVIAELGQPRAAAMRTFVSYRRNLIVVDYAAAGEQQFDIELARHQDSTGAIPNAPELGAAGRDIWVRYRFPPDPLNYPQGFEYVMYGRIVGGEEVRSEVNDAASVIAQWVWNRGTPQALEGHAVAHVKSSGTVTLLVVVATTREDADPFSRARQEVEAAGEAHLAGQSLLAEEHRQFWHDYWRRSFVHLPSKPFLTQQWFFSQYLLACCWRPGRLAPGLFGPWAWEDCPGWGNDYHWDYNMQQAIWGAFSSNHLEQTVPYDDAALALLPTAQKDAHEVYGIDGAKFFLTSYPRKAANNPFPMIHYDKMMSLNGWVAHPLWWHYLYSQDEDYLRTRAYPLMRDCAKFYAGYLTQAPDGRYDIWPTAVWDVLLSPHLKQNRNCHMDLAFIRYLMKACLVASEVLGVDADLRPVWRDIVENLRAYPTTDTPEGKVFVDFEGLPVTRFGLPIASAAIFPADDLGLHSPESVREIAWRTAKSLPYTHEGDVVLTAMAKVRLGSDELDAIEEHTRASLMPNHGMWVSNWRQVVWVHAAGWPIVVNESVLQSYTGQLRVAPVRLKTDVRFGQLRTVGAFLVSGEIRPGGEVAYLAITSTAGRPCSLVRPWDDPVRVREFLSMALVSVTETDGILSFPTAAGLTYVVDRPGAPWEQQPMQTIAAPEATPASTL